MGGGVQRCWGAFVGDIGAGGLGWTGPCGAPAGCSKGLARRVPAMCPVPGPSQPPQPLRNQCRAQVLIFVPSRHQTRATALDLINLAAADERQPRYVHMPPAELEAVMASIKVGGGEPAGSHASMWGKGRKTGGGFQVVPARCHPALFPLPADARLHLQSPGGDCAPVWRRPPSRSTPQEHSLAHCVQFGIGLLHSRMRRGDATLVKRLFAERKIQVGCRVVGGGGGFVSPAR